MNFKLVHILSILAAISLVIVVLLAVLTGIEADVPSTGDEEVMTAAPTEESTEAPTDPVYTLSFVGDCTLGCTDAHREDPNGFIKVVGEDYDYPLANVRRIFEADDFTLANLEGPLTGDGPKSEKQFVFRGPAEYTNILTGSSVEAVTTANNHSWDYGYAGQVDTNEALDAAGISHAGREGSYLHTTASGLTIGVYCDDFYFEKAHMEEAIASLREQGAEVVVCAFHWGEEKAYTPNFDQKTWAHIAIDAGADIVAGHHPHVLQPIEYYNGGVILYSLGNFCYGGSLTPYDKDTAIVQQQFVRGEDGSLTMGDTVIIPCSVSSVSDRNNYQPTPMEEGSAAYDRVMEKLGMAK